MSTKILAPIDHLVASTLNVTTAPASGVLYRDTGVSSISNTSFASAGVLDSTGSAPIMRALSSTNLLLRISDIAHTSATGTTYNISISNADTLPWLLFDISMVKVSAAGAAFPYLRFNADGGTNYVQRSFYENGSLNHLLDTYTSAPLAEVNINVASDLTNTGYSSGDAYLKSGTMRHMHYYSSQTFSGSIGFVNYNVRWTNTASTVTQVNLVVPNNVYCYSRMYQQAG